MKKILLIDDDQLVLQTVANVFKRRGFDVEIYDDGFSAIERVEEVEFDLIVCDIRMPSMNGIETMKKIRNQIKNIGFKTPKQIFLTGYAEDSLESQARTMGIDDYIYKPFDIKDFLNRVEKMLND